MEETEKRGKKNDKRRYNQGEGGRQRYRHKKERCKKACGLLKPSVDTFFLGGVFLGLHPWHMEVPRLGVKPEL